MDSMNTPYLLSQTVRSLSFQEFIASRPEAAFLLVQLLSEEVQDADGRLRMIWEQIPASCPMGSA